ncbi:MAG: excinuclease ABC subunit C [bacterium P3]|nr:MAG: excinuclease ABC subunit C [bacterium P3]KWW40642.1 MAG: excinuclease ABC subunit C [bacterium F083]
MIDAGINKHIEAIALKLKTIPETPGVYQHLDASGTVIYVGKARNLQRRVSSYFSHYEEKSPKIKMLVRNICDIRVTVVATEVDALLLENNLIKRYQPRYNSLLKDDKTYPYLCITQEDYPRILFTRNRQHKGQYFGPYPNQRILRELDGIIRQLFTYRTCNRRLERPTGETPAGTERPCMKYQIGLCKAPCAGLQSHAEYNAEIDNIRRILKGDFADITRDLKRRMQHLASELRFEEADAVKRKLQLLEEYQSRSTVVNTNVKDIDVVSVVSDARSAYVNMMRIKNGSIIYSFSSEVRKQLDESDAEILSTVIPALHEQTESTAREVVVPVPVPDLPDAYLRQTVPTRGDRLQLLELSQRNVEAYRAQCEHRRALLNPDEAAVPRSKAHLLERIQKMLQLPQPPVHIECFDNSHIQGAYAVAAMVRFTHGKPDRNAYRKYNIKGGEGGDDYASMAEILSRRYGKLAETERPQLIIVDGGKGQMEVAHRVVHEELHLDIPIAGLAKDDRHHTSELLYGYPPQVVGLKPTDPLFHLLEQMQDEVHHFAITFHKRKRSKATFRTQLTDIPGIGEKTARDLLLHFGSIKQLRLQTESDIAQLIGPAKARQVWRHLHEPEMA